MLGPCCPGATPKPVFVWYFCNMHVVLVLVGERNFLRAKYSRVFAYAYTALALM